MISRALLSIAILVNVWLTARGAHANEPGKLATISSFIADTMTVTAQGDRSDGRVLKAPNGNILLGTRNGFLLELDPTNLNRIISKKVLARDAGGISGALATFRENGQERVVVGTGAGFYCFDAQGSELARQTNFQSTLQSPPVVYDSQVFFVGNDGIAYKLDTKNWSLVRHGRGEQVGTLISNPALLITPEPIVIYGTERTGKDRKPIYSIVYAGPGEVSYFDLPRPVGAPSFTPTVIQDRHGVSVEAGVLILTDTGKLLFGNQAGLSKPKLIDIDGEPTTPLIPLEDNLLFTICLDSQSDKAKVVLLNFSGEEQSRNSIHTLDHSIVEAVPTSESTVFRDDNRRALAIMGFSDKTVKVVDIRTGAVLATSAKTSRIVEAPPTSLGDCTFFVGEEPEGYSFRCHLLKFSANVK